MRFGSVTSDSEINLSGYNGDPTIIVQDENHRFTTDTEKTTWDAKAEGNHTHTNVYEPANVNIQNHISGQHAPIDAQKNSDITKAEIEAKLVGEITSHTHPGGSEAFPVGSVFISVVSTNPSTLLGYGTWQAFGAGRILIGLDSGDNDFNTDEETGGAKVHTLSIAELPSHTHIQDAHNHTQDAHTHTQNAHNHLQRYNAATTGPASGPVTAPDTSSNTPTNYALATADTVAVNQNTTATNQATTAVNQNTGGGSSFNIMNPYIVVRFWKRIS